MILQCINTKLTNSLNESLYKAFCYQTIKNLSNTAIPQPTQIQQNKKEPEVDAAISKSKHILGKVITRFKAPIAYAFAYGSGVFKQKGYENEKKKV